VHLSLEKKLADFIGTEETILYASGFTTVSSAIPAFLKRGDLILVDSGANFAVQTGVTLSRANVKVNEHNERFKSDRQGFQAQ